MFVRGMNLISNNDTQQLNRGESALMPSKNGTAGNSFDKDRHIIT